MINIKEIKERLENGYELDYEMRAIDGTWGIPFKQFAKEQAFADLKALVEALEWVPVSERLPEESGKYWISCADGWLGVAYYDDYDGIWEVANSPIGTTQVHDTLYWMSLPPNPEKPSE
jgi:hypothetical protein